MKTRPEEAVMGIATIFASADVMDPQQDVPTLREALMLLQTYMDEQDNVIDALSWLSGCVISACELAAMGLRYGAEANDVEVSAWTQQVAKTLLSVMDGDGSE